MIGWQFQIDGRKAGPVRDRVEDAYQDAINAGWALRRNDGSVMLMRSEGAAVVRVTSSKNKPSS